MRPALDPFRRRVISLAGWRNQRQQDALDYLQEENRVLHEQLGGRRLRFNDDQRRRLAVKAKKLSWRMLHEVTMIVTPATLLAWHRWQIARKYDGRSAAQPVRAPEMRSNGWWCAWPREPGLGLPQNPGSARQSRPSSGSRHDRQHTEGAQAGTGSGAQRLSVRRAKDGCVRQNRSTAQVAG